MPSAERCSDPTSRDSRGIFSGLDSVVVVVCGGSGVDWSIMEQWREEGLWG